MTTLMFHDEGSKTIADLIDGTVGCPTCHAYFAAGATGLIVKPKRKIQL
ncbi:MULTISPECIES: hypothetical protein [Bradyrhizobium]|nr:MULTISPECIES: hypothetical protein [Bradyrhizobium]